MRKLSGHMHQRPDSHRALGLNLVEVDDVVLVRHQFISSRHAGAGSAWKVRIDELVHLLVNLQPQVGGCARVIPGNPGLNGRRGIRGGE